LAGEARLDRDNIFAHLTQRAGALHSLSDQGDLTQARAGAARLFESTFHKGYVAHAPIEPHAALAEFKDGKLTIWASTQTPFPTRDQVAQALALDVQKVRVITPYVGGGFGGKSASGQALEAARLAQITGKPVQVAWTRAEEFFNDTFDPAAVVNVGSGIDKDGRIILWDYAVRGAGERGAARSTTSPTRRSRRRARRRPGGAGVSCIRLAWARAGGRQHGILPRVADRHHGCGHKGVLARMRHWRCQNAPRAGRRRCVWWQPAVAPAAAVGLACSGTLPAATMAEVK
jgi:isoquinoline 1-oxidoreductase